MSEQEIAKARELLAAACDPGTAFYVREGRIDSGVVTIASAINAICAALRTASQENPRINIECETKSNGITGSTNLNVIRVEVEDDGSFTAVTDYWPATPASASEVK